MGGGEEGRGGFQYGALPPDFRVEPPLPSYWLQTTFMLMERVILCGSRSATNHIHKQLLW